MFTENLVLLCTLNDMTQGQIVIPKAAKDTFNLKDGDRLVVLGEETEGIALVKAVDFEEKMSESMPCFLTKSSLYLRTFPVVRFQHKQCVHLLQSKKDIHDPVYHKLKYYLHIFSYVLLSPNLNLSNFFPIV